MAPYLTQLCDSLKTSMIGDYRPTTLKVTSDAGAVTSREALSLGLIVTELILNALKHAFTDDKIDRQIAVGFAIAGTNWKLSVADNGIGAPVGVFAQAKSGLGTSIVNALAQQLRSQGRRGERPPGNLGIGYPRHFCETARRAAGGRDTSLARRQFAGMADYRIETVWFLIKPGAAR